MTEIRLVLVTAPEGEAEGLAGRLVASRLAACANVLPGIQSIYWWEGKVERGREALLVLKTTRELVEPLTKLVKELHSYTVPEVLSLPVEAGFAPYLDWVRAETRKPPSGGNAVE